MRRRQPARIRLKDAVDYSKVAALVMEVCRSRDFHLIETLAELLAEPNPRRISCSDGPRSRAENLASRGTARELRLDRDRPIPLIHSIFGSCRQIYVEEFKIRCGILSPRFERPAPTACVLIYHPESRRHSSRR